MIRWQGTFLTAAFVAPSHVWLALPEILSGWQHNGLLKQGRAQWLRLLPENASYERIMDGQEQFESVWESDANSRLEKLSTTYTLTSIVFPFTWHDGQGEMMIDFLVYPDDSVGVYLNAPYQAVYEEVSLEAGRKNLALFVDTACAICVPQTFIVGRIGEEAQFSGLDLIIRHEEPLPSDWAFYGAQVSDYVRVGLERLPAPLEVRQLPGNGLFVRWSEWDEPIGSSPEWRRCLVQAVDHVRLQS